jgi:hypothetical protein
MYRQTRLKRDTNEKDSTPWGLLTYIWGRTLDLSIVVVVQRKQFIKQVVDHRYALVAAHVEYIQALGGIGQALRVFAELETLLLSFSVPPSPVMSSSEKKSSEPIVGPEKSSTTSSLHLHSDSHSHHSHSHSGSHSHHSHSHSTSPGGSPASPLKEYRHWESPPLYTSPPRMDFLRSGNTPSRTYEERPFPPERVTWDSYSDASQSQADSFCGISLVSAPALASSPGPSYSPNHPPPSPPVTKHGIFFKSTHFGGYHVSLLQSKRPESNI